MIPGYGSARRASAWTRECRALHPHVRFGLEADISPVQLTCPLYPPKADLCGALGYARFGPKADACMATRTSRNSPGSIRVVLASTLAPPQLFGPLIWS